MPDILHFVLQQSPNLRHQKATEYADQRASTSSDQGIHLHRTKAETNLLEEQSPNLRHQKATEYADQRASTSSDQGVKLHRSKGETNLLEDDTFEANAGKENEQPMSPNKKSVRGPMHRFLSWFRLCSRRRKRKSDTSDTKRDPASASFASGHDKDNTDLNEHEESYDTSGYRQWVSNPYMN
ncbi:uncharacterized protein [Periplaneta americana]|uniref:uncharacterized protein n=1 Tax=Periplaneta americana TaxID=6978 RepID=UPI0037E9598D